ncbi:MAG: condensation domain-containing protein, partial [Gemmatimonadota bacterium]
MTASNRSRRIEAIYPLSPMQQGMLFHTLLEPESGAYFEQMACRLRGALDVDAFERAWKQVVARHAALRTAFAWRGSEKPVQAVAREASLPFEVLDWRDASPEESERRYREFLQSDRARGFDLSRAPLMRIALLRFGDVEHGLVWSFHHILLDGWTYPILLGEVFSLYEAACRGETARLPDPRPYRDYIAWLERQDGKAAREFWTRELAGFERSTPLPTVRFAKPGARSSFEKLEVSFGPDLTASLEEFARSLGVTLSTLLHGAWGLVLARHAGEADVVFGSTVSGRPADLAGSEGMVGLFINTLPVRVRVDEGAEVG